jgi:hypothetical protein
MKTLILDALLVITLGLMIWQNYQLRERLDDYAAEIHKQYDDKFACEHQLSLCQQGLYLCSEDPQGK